LFDKEQHDSALPVTLFQMGARNIPEDFSLTQRGHVKRQRLLETFAGAAPVADLCSADTFGFDLRYFVPSCHKCASSVADPCLRRVC
jgi:hypothetical protein